MEELIASSYVLADFFPDQAYWTFIKTWYQQGTVRCSIRNIDAPRPEESKNSRKKGSCQWLENNTKAMDRRQLFQGGGSSSRDTLCARLTNASTLTGTINEENREMGLTYQTQAEQWRLPQRTWGTGVTKSEGVGGTGDAGTT